MLLLATHLAHDTAEVGAQLCGVSAPGTPALEEPLVSQQRPPQQVGLVRGQVLAVEASVVIIIIVCETDWAKCGGYGWMTRDDVYNDVPYPR